MTGKLFGTDGIRGTANQYPMTAEVALKFAMAAGSHFKSEGHRNRVVIAKDTRLSGYLLEPALTSGFISVGMDVILVGPMPTPAVSMLMKSLRADLGVMLSASHNPYDDNGIKLFGRNGYKLSDECEDKLQDLILNNNLDRHLVAPEELGRAKRLDDAPGRYIEHVKKSFPKGKTLSGLRIVIDCANGAAYHMAPTIFWELGAEVVKLGCDPDGFNINQGCGSTQPEQLAQRVIETRADVGIALDGDADRVIMCDEKGKTICGDHILGMIAANLKEHKRLKGDSVVVTQMSNGGLEEYITNELGLKFWRTPVGDRYVSEKMKEVKSNLGGEQSGHIIMGDFASTGDGMVAALQVLSVLVDSGKKMSEIARPFDMHPQTILNVKFRTKNPLESKEAQASIDKIQKQSDARILVRKSGTEKKVRIMVEGKDKDNITDIAKKLERVISDLAG